MKILAFAKQPHRLQNQHNENSYWQIHFKIYTIYFSTHTGSPSTLILIHPLKTAALPDPIFAQILLKPTT